MNEQILKGTYDLRLVALSVGIAMCAAYAALDLAGRTSATQGRARFAWLTGGAVAMGLGIWSMHYIGMLALSLPVPVLYDLPTVLLSLVAAIFASAVALYVVSQPELLGLPIVMGSIFMGAGICAMHYIGMAAMRLQAECRYSVWLVSASVVIAIVVSFVALWLAFRFRAATRAIDVWKIASAAVMGLAVASMHYTGMAAASFVSFPGMAGMEDTSHAVHVSELGVAGISIVTFLILSFAVGTSLVDRRFSRQAQLLARSEERYRLLYERSQAAVYRSRLDGTILECNSAFASLLGYSSPREIQEHRKSVV